MSPRRPGEPSARPAWPNTAEILRDLLGYAVLAPSRHNSQPWLFEIEGPEARVYSDARRALHAADPGGREMILSCGAALENLRLAVRARGHDAAVEVLAARPGGLVARLRLEEHLAPTPDEEALFASIPRRRTNRLAFDEREPPPGLVARLARDAADAGASLRVVELGARRAVAEVVAFADRAQWESQAFRAEAAAWSRVTHTRAGDGVPGSARGLGEAASLVERLRMRFASHVEPEQRRDRQHLLHAPSLVALTTRADEPRDWAHAGFALQRVLLRATSAGLSASYYSAAIEIPRARSALRVILGEAGHPQVLFRLGRGPPVGATPRRPPAAVLRAYRGGSPSSAALVRRT